MDDFKEILENNINHFQENLPCIRALLDITMAEAGELLGVSRQSIMALEAEQTKMTILQYVGLKSAFYRIYKHALSTEEKKITNGILNAFSTNTLLLPFGGIAATYASSRLQKKIFKQESLINSLKTTYGGKDAEEILENTLSLRDINNFYDECHKKTREQRSNFSREKNEELKRKEEELKRKEEELKRKEEELKRKIDELEQQAKTDL